MNTHHAVPTKRAPRKRPLVQIALLILTVLSVSALGLAQNYPPLGYPPPDASAPPPPPLSPPQLDQVVARIALYPDPLLAQVLAAATYPDQIPDAADWADEHHYLQGQDLANAITGDQLPWDPSVQALLPFPSVLDMMASDMTWTTQLGDAFLDQQVDVQNAIQHQRQIAYQYGYLRSNSDITVTSGPYYTIMPANPSYIIVPAYDPGIVYFPPRPGIVVGGAVHFGFGVTIGGFFRPWGWGYDRFDWGRHEVIINNSPWRRDWRNRVEYRHPYPAEVRHYTPAPRDEFRGRAEVERGRMPEARRPETRPAPPQTPVGRGAPQAGRAEPPRPSQTPQYARPAPGGEQHAEIPRSPEERSAPQGGSRAPAEQHRGGNSGGNNRDGGNRDGRK